MVTWISLGFDEEAFWGITPKIFSIHVEAAESRLTREYNDRAFQAWQTAVWAVAAYVGKAPKPKEFLIDAGKKKRKSKVNPETQEKILASRMKALDKLPNLPKMTWEEWQNQSKH